jgi:hypothetical protein
MEGAAQLRRTAKANYGLQGWKRGRVYPDCTSATAGQAGNGRIVVLEIKGQHLKNPDTDDMPAVIGFDTELFMGSGCTSRPASACRDRRDGGMRLDPDAGHGCTSAEPDSRPEFGAP